jgi:molybdate transport system substrate-binding protein
MVCSKKWMIVCFLICLVCGCRRGASSERTLVVFAASSLTEAFQACKRQFEKARPGVRVAFSFSGSQVLRLQLSQGAYADLYASANAVHMEQLKRQQLVKQVTTFAYNQLVLVVPAKGTSRVRSFRELPKAKRLVIGTAQVPVGQYTRELLRRGDGVFGAGFRKRVMSRVVSEEHNVRLVRAKVLMGEADAAIVYQTDTVGVKGLSVVPMPPKLQMKAGYTIGLVSGTKQPDVAASWLSFLASPKGRAILKRHGFVVK